MEAVAEAESTEEAGPAGSDGPIIDLDEPLPKGDEEPKELREAVEGLLTEPVTEGEPKPSVDDLFARIRAARAEGVEAPATPAAAEPPDEPGDDGPLDPDAALVQARAIELGPLQATLARQLKRALADEQNEVFDRLRRMSKVTSSDDVLGSDTDHAERYRAAGEDAVWAAALCRRPLDGTRGRGGRGRPRGRVGASPGARRGARRGVPGGRDAGARAPRSRPSPRPTAIPRRRRRYLRNAYREWKAQRIDELAGELLLSAYRPWRLRGHPARHARALGDRPACAGVS